MVKQKALRRRIRASVHIQRIIRGRFGRKRFMRFLKVKQRLIGAVKMQSLFRRFKAVVYVEKHAEFLRSARAILTLQCFLRTIRARKRTHRQRLWMRSVVRIQCFARVVFARRKCRLVRQLRAVVRIQRIARGRFSRRRVKRIRRVRNNASQIIGNLILGWRVRRRWTPIIHQRCLNKKLAILMLQSHLRACLLGKRTRRRLKELQIAARRIQKAFHKMVARRIAGNLIHDIRCKAITKIQKLWRGKMGRLRVEIIKYSLQNVGNPLKMYYLLKFEYFRAQNMFHRPYVLKIQNSYRCRLARLKVNRIRRMVRASIIQRRFRMYLATKAAKHRLKQLREARALRDKSILNIQRVVRGFMGRYEANKHYRADEVKWFLHEIKATGLIGRALSQFRVRKRALDRQNAACVVIQALVRGVLSRAWFKSNYKRLLRERDKRIKIRRERACIVIQSKFFRVVLACRYVEKKRYAMREYVREQQLMAEFESRIDGIHEDHLKGLLATRIETGVRESLAKRHVVDLKAKDKELKIQQALQRKNDAARSIQALVRGVQGRVRFNKSLPALKKARTARGFCVECEGKVARRRCRDCKDNFCEACFEKLHKKGRRKDHNWEPIQDKSDRGATASASRGGDRGNKAGDKSSKAIKWEEYWDESAQANYWYNVDSGEATWIKPAGFKG